MGGLHTTEVPTLGSLRQEDCRQLVRGQAELQRELQDERQHTSKSSERSSLGPAALWSLKLLSLFKAELHRNESI